jgi:DNA ligase D-like protein (predicted 3'-phosphoesterase)
VTADDPIYVVQLHQATQLHHDLRLEIDGVLVSWAVPKGPAEEPGVRRLAVRVGDHDLAHAEVQGPQERGWVEIVDRGTFEHLTEEDGRPLTAELALAAGHLRVRLDGGRYTGTWSLRRTSMGGDDRNWLLQRRS